MSIKTLALVSILPFATTSWAATVTMNPAIDSFVSSANPNNNYGGAGALAISASGLPKGEMQSVMQFDTSSALTTFGSGSWTMTQVTLTLSAQMPNNAVFNSPSAAGSLGFSWMQNDSWTEGNGTPMMLSSTGGITYSTLSSFLSSGDQALGTVSYNGGTSGTTSLNLTLASGLLSDITSGSLLSIRVFANDTAVSGVFNSKTGAVKPVLTITATPEPSTALLLAAGVLGIYRRRRIS